MVYLLPADIVLQERLMWEQKLHVVSVQYQQFCDLINHLSTFPNYVEITVLCFFQNVFVIAH